MHKYFKVIIGVVVTAVLATATLMSTQAAGNASFILSPSSGSYNRNSNITVTININTGSDTANVANLYINYDASKLQFVSINNSGTAFDTQVDNVGGSGTVHISRFQIGSPVSGTKRYSQVTFKALAGSGSSSLTLGTNSEILSATDASNIWNESTTGATFSFKTPASSSSSGSGGTSSSAKPSTPAKTTPAKPSSTSTPQTDKTKEDTASDKAEASKAPTGYLVNIKVVDGDGVPVVDQVVELNNQSAKTDATGVAGFPGVPAGSYEVSVGAEESGKTLASITVSDSTPANEVQQFEVKQQTKRNLLVFAIPILLIGALVVLSKFLKKRRLAKRFTTKHMNGSSTPIPPAQPTAANLPSQASNPEVPQSGQADHPDTTGKPPGSGIFVG